jgi:hypothetical protein
MSLPRRDDPGRKDPRPVGRDVVVARRARSVQIEHGHARVVVVHEFALCGLPSQFGQRRLQPRGGVGHDLPLGRGRQRNLQVRLEPLEAVERHAAAILQEGDHRAGGRIVLLRAHARGRIGREELAAEVTAQFLQGVDRCGDRRLTHEPDEHARVPLAIHGARARRTPIPVVQLRVGDGDLPGAGVGRRSVPAMAARVAIGLVVAGRPWRRRRVDAGAREHVARLLGRRAEEQLPQPVERRALLLDQVRQIAQGVNRRLERRVLALGQRRVPRPVHQPLEILHT